MRLLTQLRRLRIGQADDRLEYERLKRMTEHVYHRMENRLLEIENLETALELHIVQPERAA